MAPKILSDMTDAEIGAMVREDTKENTVVEMWNGEEWEVCIPGWCANIAYRVREPEPKRETVTLTNFHERARGHSITLPLIDGKPPTGTFTNAEGETIAVARIADDTPGRDG